MKSSLHIHKPSSPIQAELKGHQPQITSIRVIDTKQAATTDMSNAMILWDLPDDIDAKATGESLTLQEICFCEFYLLGKKLVTVGMGRILKIWNVETLALEGKFEWKSHPRDCGIISPPKNDENEVKMILIISG